jgi:micrococcal nuclease
LIPPEVYGGAECFGEAASAFTKRLLPAGRGVRYRSRAEPRDRYGRALAYVWLGDGRKVNGLLVERGYARPYTFPPNDDFAPLFGAADRRARRRGLGLWARGRGCASQAGDHQAARASGGRSSGGDLDCSDFHTRAEAQRYFDSHGGGPSDDVEGLDGGDRDGRVCESLP